jgi:hypothetical protein
MRMLGEAMLRKEKFIRNAETCEKHAALVKDPATREDYLELACSWRQMADEINEYPPPS